MNFTRDQNGLLEKSLKSAYDTSRVMAITRNALRKGARGVGVPEAPNEVQVAEKSAEKCVQQSWVPETRVQKPMQGLTHKI